MAHLVHKPVDLSTYLSRTNSYILIPFAYVYHHNDENHTELLSLVIGNEKKKIRREA